MTAPRIVVATRSPHKLSEIRDILREVPASLVSLAELEVEPEPEEERIEVHGTFAENALAKARHFHRRVGLPTLADDSGLCVDALDGGPGVRTKRFAPDDLAARWGRDEANNRHLLERLRAVPEDERGAEYRCAIAAVGGAGGDADAAFVSEGRVRGRIGFHPRGQGGFGYDPLFVLPSRSRTFAELPDTVKRESSHRARALRGLAPWLDALIQERKR